MGRQLRLVRLEDAGAVYHVMSWGGRQEAISLDDEDLRQFLKTRRKGDPLKMELAAEIRKQTSMTMAWIAKELNAGAPNSVWNAMRRWRSGV